MNDSPYTIAATLIGEAASIEQKRAALLGRIAAWSEANPYMVYGDYRDELSDDEIDALLTSRTAFDEMWSEREFSAGDYADWSYTESELCTEFGDEICALWPDECGDIDPDELEFDDCPDDVQEAHHGNRYVDCSDLLDSCLRNASPKIVAILIDPDAPSADEDGQYIGPPNYELDESENELRQQYLQDKFGIDGWKAESCYWHESLKAMGTLDLREVYEKGLPETITIDPDTMLIFHTSWSGSGCMGDVKASKSVTLPAKFSVDSGRYGIDSVYGFTGSVWRNPLAIASWKAWE